MVSKEEKTITALLGALGLIIFLGGIFLKLYPVTVGLAVGISFWVLAGLIKMRHGGKRVIVSAMGALGLIVLIVGLFTDLYEFYPYGLFAAISIWILSGVVATYLGVKK